MADNPYVNKVVLGNETLIDITDTTATANDVAQGKYFYNAAGAKTAGAYSPQGGLPQGGSQGEVLYKSSSTDYDADWGEVVHVGASAPTDSNVQLWLDTSSQGTTVPSPWTLLWENSNPNNNFNAQTITFSDDYDLYMIIFKRQPSGVAYEAETIFRHGSNVFMVHGSGYSNKFYSRDAVWHNGGGLEVNAGYAGTGTADASCIIPLAIYGIHGVITI